MRKKKKKKKPVIKNFQKSDILTDLPKYLIKQSGTYFKKMNHEFSYRTYTETKAESSNKKPMVGPEKDVSEF